MAPSPASPPPTPPLANATRGPDRRTHREHALGGRSSSSQSVSQSEKHNEKRDELLNNTRSGSVATTQTLRGLRMFCIEGMVALQFIVKPLGGYGVLEFSFGQTVNDGSSFLRWSSSTWSMSVFSIHEKKNRG